MILQWDEDTRQEAGRRRYMCGDHAGAVQRMVAEVEPPKRER